MRANRLREIWRAGRKASNCWLSLASVFAAETIAHQGWDSVLIDMQHAPTDFATVYAMLIAVSTTDTVPLVRVPWNEPDEIQRVLDAGAYGVMCPSIETVEDAQRFVGAARYHPMGYRSVGPNRAALYGGADYVAHANETILTIAQIETAKGLANMEAIAKVPGLDMLFVGPSDLALSLGRPMNPNPDDKVTLEAVDRILHTAHAAGIYAGMFSLDPEYARTMMKKGFDLVTCTADITMIGAGKKMAGSFK
jgi:4-hydroxy-2-oxoheptanedioate aldolase